MIFPNIIIKLVRKHTGIENIISNILTSIDNIKAIYLVGDYAKGMISLRLRYPLRP